MAVYRNLLEPENLIGLFLRYPPHGFSVIKGEGGVPCFHVPYNLFTTFEPETLARLQKLPLYKHWSKLLTLRTCFAGTTVSEYAVFDSRQDAKAVIADIVREGAGEKLVVVKDVPCESPLLGAQDNAFAAALRKEAREQGFIDMEGQALAYVLMDFPSLEAYFARFSASRRKDLRRKMKSRELLEVQELPLGDPVFFEQDTLDLFYALYLQVFEQSEVHFDLLGKEFFTALLQSAMPGVVMVYRHKDELVGYNICLIHENRLVDKYIGLRYPQARELNLYFVSWMVNLEYALKHSLQAYVAGWTDPKVKAALGASFTFTRHLARMGNPLLRNVMLPFRRFFEGDSRTLEKQ